MKEVYKEQLDSICVPIVTSEAGGFHGSSRGTEARRYPKLSLIDKSVDWEEGEERTCRRWRVAGDVWLLGMPRYRLRWDGRCAVLVTAILLSVVTRLVMLLSLHWLDRIFPSEEPNPLH